MRHLAMFGGKMNSGGNSTFRQFMQCVDRKYGRDLWRGRLPETNLDFQVLRDLGITKIVNLESGVREFFAHEINDEVYSARYINADVLHIRFSAIFPPRLRDLMLSVEILNGLLVEGNTYFHCRRGKERTGMVAAAWRMRMQGWKILRARDEMRERGFSRWFFLWEARLWRFAKQYPRIGNGA